MHNSFKNTLNSTKTQVSEISATESNRLSRTQSVQFSKCAVNVHLLNTTQNMYRMINATKPLSIFSENTLNESTKYKYNTLVHRKENDIRNER